MPCTAMYAAAGASRLARRNTRMMHARYTYDARASHLARWNESDATVAYWPHLAQR